MKNHRAICGIVLLLSSLAVAKPNIVYLFADQMRAAAMGCMGDKLVQTPNLDKLASQGMLATNAYSCSPVCTPYRAQLMTGRYGWHTGVEENDIKLPNSETCIAEVFKNNGYATGYIGKWHLNGDRSGFVQLADRQGWDFWAALACSHEYFNTKYYYDDPNSPVIIKNGYEPDSQTTEAIGFMKRNAKKPFILMVSYGPPHNPYPPPANFDIYKPADIPIRPNVPAGSVSSARNTIAQYYGLTTSVDYQVGRIMKTLDSLGLTDSTIIAFSSDHGDMLYSQGQTLKQKPWQEAANIPFIIRYPGHIAAAKSDILINSIDVMPTLLGLSGITPPPGVDGKNLAPLMTGASSEEQQYIMMSMKNFNSNGVGWDWRAIRDKEWKYVMHPKGGWLLYNLKDDPYEMHNLIDSAKYRDQYGRLHAALVAMRKAAGDNAVLTYVNNPPVHSTPPAVSTAQFLPNAPGDIPLFSLSGFSRHGSAYAIRYRVPDAANPAVVSLRIYKANGQLVKTFGEGTKTPGDYSLRWDGTGDNGRPVQNGYYSCRFKCGPASVLKSLVCLK